MGLRVRESRVASLESGTMGGTKAETRLHFLRDFAAEGPPADTYPKLKTDAEKAFTRVSGMSAPSTRQYQASGRMIRVPSHPCPFSGGQRDARAARPGEQKEPKERAPPDRHLAVEIIQPGPRRPATCTCIDECYCHLPFL
jgi:hypothetical protein